MFDRFDEDALRAFSAAQEEARSLEHREMEPSHLLLGLLTEEWFTSSQLVGWLGFSTSDIRETVAAALMRGVGGVPCAHIPLGAALIKTLNLSMKESHRFKDVHVGTEHLLLGVLREDKSRAARVLGGIGIDYRTTLNALKEFRSRA